MPSTDPDYYKKYYEKNKEKAYWRNLKNKFGLSKETFWDLFFTQDGKCGLCRKPFESFRGNALHVDHCHDTGQVRGLLCMTCNVALGMLGDNVQGLERALNYLKGEIQ